MGVECENKIRHYNCNVFCSSASVGFFSIMCLNCSFVSRKIHLCIYMFFFLLFCFIHSFAFYFLLIFLKIDLAIYIILKDCHNLFIYFLFAVVISLNCFFCMSACMISKVSFCLFLSIKCIQRTHVICTDILKVYETGQPSERTVANSRQVRTADHLLSHWPRFAVNWTFLWLFCDGLASKAAGAGVNSFLILLLWWV